MIDKKKAIKVIKQPRKSGGARTVYVFYCKKCVLNTVNIRSTDLKKSKQLCRKCTQQKRPFESIYNRLFNDHRKTEVKLTYKEFLEFTKIKRCYYCDSKINWVPYATLNQKFISCAHHLDRIDHSKPYHKDNIVVACTVCNKMRSNKFTAYEFKFIGEALRKIYRMREGLQIENYDELTDSLLLQASKKLGW